MFVVLRWNSVCALLRVACIKRQKHSFFICLSLGAQVNEEGKPILVYKESGKVLQGDRGVLRCMFSGYPVPDVEWISPKSQVIKNTPGRYEISDFGRVLTIPRAEADFEGFYFCKGKGKTHSEIHSVFLNVTSAPLLEGENQMQDIILPVGENAIFLCNVSSLPNEHPPSSPKWKKNGVDIEIDKEEYTVSENKRMLTVTGVQNGTDTGVYQCISENSEGILIQQAFLLVMGRISHWFLEDTFLSQSTSD
ncbi:neurofascin-like [Crassostrea virginica]